MRPTSLSLIARKNDAMRQTFVGCRVMATIGVSRLPDVQRYELMKSVQNFEDFDDSNDPYNERDFGKVTLADGSEYFWKFDYYDDAYEYFQQDGNRVLTIMRTDEY